MDKHIKILGAIYIFIGGLLALSVISVHLRIFSSGDFFDYSVMSKDFGISRFFGRYVELLNLYGIGLASVISVLLTILSSLAFGIGILRRGSCFWAAYLGFLLALVGVISTALSFSTDRIAISLLQILLSAYTFWVLSSKEMKRQMTGA